MKSIKRIILSLVIAASAAIPAVLPVSAYAIDEGARDAACEGVGAIGGNCASGDDGVNNLVATAINILSWVVGVAAVIMIIIGGFKYVVSNGDSNAISSAKSTILYALIGLVIAVLAQGIVRFVLKEATTSPGSPDNVNIIRS